MAEILPTSNCCAKCGRVTQGTICYHDGKPFHTLHMTLKRAIEVSEEYKERLQGEVNEAEGRIRRYSQLLEEQK